MKLRMSDNKDKKQESFERIFNSDSIDINKLSKRKKEKEVFEEIDSAVTYIKDKKSKKRDIYINRVKALRTKYEYDFNQWAPATSYYAFVTILLTILTFTIRARDDMQYASKRDSKIVLCCIFGLIILIGIYIIIGVIKTRKIKISIKYLTYLEKELEEN